MPGAMKARQSLALVVILLIAIATLKRRVLEPASAIETHPTAITVLPTAVALRQDWPSDPITPVKTLGEKWSVTDPESRGRLLDEFAAVIDAPLIPDLLQRATDWEPEEMRFPLQRALLCRLASTDPWRAASLADVQLSGLHRSMIRLDVALEWAVNDLPAAVAWITQWEAGSACDITVWALTTQLGGRSPQTAVEQIAALPPGPLKLDLLDGLAEEWSSRSFDAALAWAKSLVGDEERTRVLLRLGYQWQLREPDAALAYALAFPDGNDLLAMQLANHLAQRDPLAAAEWAIALPDGERQDKILTSVMVTWAQQDPIVSAEIATLFPPGPVQHEALAGAIAAWMMRDTGAAAEWVGSLPAGSLREYAIDQVASRWRNADPARTVAWLDRLAAGSAEKGEAARWERI